MSESEEFSADIIEGWRITIPKSARKDLQLKKGDRLRVVIKKRSALRGDTIL